MKRKQPSTEDEPQYRRRQPQVSCDFCRSKKLKCDRGAPCSACAVRGFNCSGPPGSRPTLSEPIARTEADSSILSRLQKLERAVFGTRREADATLDPVRGEKNQIQTTPGHVSSPSYQDSEHQQTAKFLDSAYTRNYHQGLLRAGRLRFRIATDGTLPGGDDTSRSAWIMTREEALLLLQDFVDNPYHLLPIVHHPSARSSVDKFYTQLERGQAGDVSIAALVLSIAATSASFFHENTSSQHVFSSAENAAQASTTWSQAALNILEEPHPTTSSSLEEVQAWAILAYVCYNTEGCSARFRFLHNCSVAVARDMSLHIIDSPAIKGHEDVVTTEIKRRLWWHLASTDWLLGLMGGPLDGTYAVQPRHMNVKYPRNLNDNDFSMSSDTLTFPLNIPTQMSCFLQRIRLAEICRSIIDARDPGLPDVEITNFNKVSALDRLFEQFFSDLPPFLQTDAPIPPGAPRHLALQRALILLGFHIRRARLHRPFLLHDTENPHYQPSRHQCLRSSRTVLSISVGLLDGSLHLRQALYSGGHITYRLGLIISATFMACTVLALNAFLNSSHAGDGLDDSVSCTNMETQAELDRVCRALAAAGKESPVAAGLVRSLSSVLRQHRVKEIDHVEGSSGLPSDHGINNGPITREADAEASRGLVEEEVLQTGEQASAAGEFDFDELRYELFSTMPMTDGYDQLFAGLDSFYGPT